MDQQMQDRFDAVHTALMLLRSRVKHLADARVEASPEVLADLSAFVEEECVQIDALLAT